MINGFRNRDLRQLIFGSAGGGAGKGCTAEAAKREAKRRSAAVSRKLRMLRAHGLIRKVPRSHRYHVTDRGRAVIAAIIAACGANVNQLSQLSQLAA